MFKPNENLTYTLRRDLLIQYRNFYIDATKTLPIRNEQNQITYLDVDDITKEKEADKKDLKIKYFYWILDQVTEFAKIPVSKQSIRVDDRDSSRFDWELRSDMEPEGTFTVGYLKVRQECLEIASGIYSRSEKMLMELSEKPNGNLLTRANVIDAVAEDINTELQKKFLWSSSKFVKEATQKLGLGHKLEESSRVHSRNESKSAWFVPILVEDHKELEEEVQQALIQHRLKIFRIIGEVLQCPIQNFEHEGSKSSSGLPEISFERLISEIYKTKFDFKPEPIPGIEIEKGFSPFPAEIATVITHLRDVFGIAERRRFLLELARHYKIIVTRVTSADRYTELNRLFKEGPL